MRVSPKITSVAALEPGMLDVAWNDGVFRRVDVSSKLCGHVLLKMLNIPEVFRDVDVVHNGGGVRWINGADFCSDAIRIWSDEQTSSKGMSH